MSTEDDKGTVLETVRPDSPGFKDRVTPKKDTSKVYLLECTKIIGKEASPVDTGPYREGADRVCGSIHFRHAGYVEHMMPYLMPNDERKVNLESFQVKICVKCKSAYIWIMNQLYDISDRIDLKAWEKTEKEVLAATGPGGQC